MSDKKKAKKRSRVEIGRTKGDANELTPVEMKKVKGGANTAFNITFGSQTTSPPQGLNTGTTIGGALGPDAVTNAFGDGSVRKQ